MAWSEGGGGGDHTGREKRMELRDESEVKQERSGSKRRICLPHQGACKAPQCLSLIDGCGA